MLWQRGSLSCWMKVYEQAEGVTDVRQPRLSPTHTPSPPCLLVLCREFCRVLFTNKCVLILSGEGLLGYCQIQRVLLGLHGIFPFEIS